MIKFDVEYVLISNYFLGLKPYTNLQSAENASG